MLRSRAHFPFGRMSFLALAGTVGIVSTVGAVTAGLLAVPAHAASVSIATFQVSPSRVTAAGGRVTFSWRTSGAVSCSISSSVHLHTMPVGVGCGTSSRAITLPGANSISNKSFVFTFSARARSLTAVARVIVVRLARRPQVDAVYRSIQGGAASDSLRVRATVRYARSCTLRVSPSVAGLPDSADCAKGQFLKAVPIPKNRGTAGRTYKITVSATSPTGVTTSRATTVNQPPTAPAPVITRFAISPATLASSGGRYTAVGTVRNAQTCSLKIVPAITNPPSPVSCAGGSYTQSFAMPANTVTASRHYSFTLTAGRGGNLAGATISRNQLAAAPSVTDLRATPAMSGSAGGNYTISATIGYAASCTFSSNPAITGSTATFSCSAATFSRSVTVPANTTSMARTYTFTLQATGPGGTATATLTITQPADGPAITNYSANPSTLTSDGGALTFSATVARATSCTLTPTASLEVPTTVSCSGGSFSHSLTVPVNTSGSTRSYTFELAATGPSGTTSQTITLPQPTQPPYVSDLTIEPSSVAADGGKVTIGATIANATSCTLSSSPGLGLDAGSFACNGSLRRTIGISANTTDNVRMFQISLEVSGPGGQASAVYTVAQRVAPPTLTNYRSKPSSIPGGGGRLTFTATLTHSSTCTFTPPSSLGASSTIGCSGGSFSKSLNVAANHTGANRTYSFLLKATGSGGGASATITLIQPPAP